MSSVGMNPQSLLQSLPSLNNFSTSGKSNSRDYQNGSVRNGLSATSITKSYSQTSLAIEFTSDDGDTVSLSYQAVEYSESVMKLQSETDPEKIKELAAYIKDQFQSMKNNLLKSLFGDDENTTTELQSEQQMEIPEYWNAENTSNRIVEFAVSFYDAAGVAGEEYLNQIRSAIDDGFKQAKDILGELPEKTADLVQNTYDLVMKKLDSWAQEKGITSKDVIST
jgi:hypothetical protein